MPVCVRLQRLEDTWQHNIKSYLIETGDFLKILVSAVVPAVLSLLGGAR